MQSFRKVSQLGSEEAKYYLESSGWDLSKALCGWRLEDWWEAEQVRNVEDSARGHGVSTVKLPSMLISNQAHSTWREYESHTSLLTRRSLRSLTLLAWQ